MAQKRLVIFGGGFVGMNLAKMATEQLWDVTICDIIEREHGWGISWTKTDITKKEEVEKVVSEIKPDFIVNVAAIADIDKAEKEKELAYAINVEGALHICEASRNHEAKYLFFSSDAIFSGKDNEYSERDTANPANYYGFTKAEAEKKIIECYPEAIIIRISLVLGYSIAGGNSFFDSLKKKLDNNEEIKCNTREIRTPIDVYSLSYYILKLFERGFTGVINIGARNSINRFELTKKISSILGYDDKKIIAQIQSGQELCNRAPRHENGTLNTELIENVLNEEMPDVDKVILNASKRRY